MATDAIGGRDPSKLFDESDAEYDMPAKLLHDVLARHRAVWQHDKRSSPGIRDLLTALTAMGAPIRALESRYR